MSSGSGARQALETRFGASRVIEEHQGQPSVLEFAVASGAPSIVKLWWPGRGRRWWRSSGTARRRAAFLEACRRLEQAGFLAPRPDAWGDLGQVRWVRYAKIPGHTLRDLSGGGQQLDVAALTAFLCELHDRGIYVRALNLGNLLATGATPPLALLDVGGTRFFRRGLSRRRRARSLARLLTHTRDLALQPRDFAESLVRAYAACLGLSPARFRVSVSRQLRRSVRQRNRRRARRGAAPLDLPGLEVK